MSIGTLYTVTQFAEKNPALSEGALRWQIFNAEQNGLAAAGAIRHVGRRVYIVEERYWAWLDTIGSKPTSAGESVRF